MMELPPRTRTIDETRGHDTMFRSCAAPFATKADLEAKPVPSREAREVAGGKATPHSSHLAKVLLADVRRLGGGRLRGALRRARAGHGVDAVPVRVLVRGVTSALGGKGLSDAALGEVVIHFGGSGDGGGSIRSGGGSGGGVGGGRGGGSRVDVGALQEAVRAIERCDEREAEGKHSINDNARNGTARSASMTSGGKIDRDECDVQRAAARRRAAEQRQKLMKMQEKDQGHVDALHGGATQQKGVDGATD